MGVLAPTTNLYPWLSCGNMRWEAFAFKNSANGFPKVFPPKKQSGILLNTLFHPYRLYVCSDLIPVNTYAAGTGGSFYRFNAEPVAKDALVLILRIGNE